MLREFLLETSIHGLRYLAVSTNTLVRLTWAACVATSAAAAAVVIYYNVANWENSPTVVTSVKPALVEVTIQMQLSPH